MLTGHAYARALSAHLFHAAAESRHSGMENGDQRDKLISLYISLMSGDLSTDAILNDTEILNFTACIENLMDEGKRTTSRTGSL